MPWASALLGHRNEGVRLAGPVPLAVVFSSSWLPRGGVVCVGGGGEIGLGSEVLGELDSAVCREGHLRGLERL